MTTIYLYSVYCQTEGIYKEVWGVDPPSLCPTNTSDTLDLNSISIKQSISEEVSKVTQDTEGLLQFKGIKGDIPVGLIGDKTNIDISFPHDIRLLNACIGADSANIGDGLEIIVGPDTIIGTLSANANIGDNVLTVSSGIFNIPQLRKGVEISLFDGVTSNKCGRLIGIDSENNQITVETPLTSAFVTGNFVRLSLAVVKDYYFHPSKHEQCIGMKGMQSLLLKANTVLRFEYTNNSVNAKAFNCQLEYYYS